MFNKNNFFNKLNKVIKIVDENKKSKSKREDTLEKYKSISEMQSFIDMSEEKKNLLIEVIRTSVDETTSKKISEKGVVVYIKFLEVIKLIEEDFIKNNIEFKTITGAVTVSKRIKIVDAFNADPTNKVLIISDAGGESLDIRCTNEIILYNIPSGIRAYNQTIGRICRGNFDSANIRLIQVENSIDQYMFALISSRKELQMELLHCDSIPLGQINSFNKDLLNAIKKKLLWCS